MIFDQGVKVRNGFSRHLAAVRADDSISLFLSIADIVGNWARVIFDQCIKISNGFSSPIAAVRDSLEEPVLLAITAIHPFSDSLFLHAVLIQI